VQELGQRVHVVPLEGVHVPGEQVTLFGVEWPDRVGISDLGLRERRARTLQRAVDRCDRGVQQLRDLGGRPGEYFAQDQHRPLLRWQVLQRGDEREPHGVAGDSDLGRVTVGQHPAVRDRLDPDGFR
jgi:hypothetical protein